MYGVTDAVELARSASFERKVGGDIELCPDDTDSLDFNQDNEEDLRSQREVVGSQSSWKSGCSFLNYLKLK